MREAVIVAAVRSPGGRYRRGGLAATRADQFGLQVVKGLLAKVPQLDPRDVDDLIVGCAFPEAETGMNLGRVLALGAGLPIETSGMTINRFCSSGLQAIADATAKIRAGWSDVIIAGGCETMSHIPMGGSRFRPDPDWGSRPNTYVSMGITAENVAARHNVSREDQDKMGVESNRRAAEALKAGKFKDETIPVKAWRYKKDAAGRRVREEVPFSEDDGVRWPTTVADLAKLKPAFKAGGSVTAGNSSQMTDGAAFTLLMTAEKAKALGLNPVARLAFYAVAGCAPEEMGMGPSVAIPKVLKLAGLKTDDIDLFEINEAFASQAIASCRLLGIEERYWKGDINPNGGAIALGHPIGASGARVLTTLLYAMQDRGAQTGLATLCLGGGEAVALSVEIE